MSSRTNPAALRDEIRGAFRKSRGKALNHKQVASNLGIVNHDAKKLVMRLLEELAEDGVLEVVGRGKYALKAVEEAPVEGTIQITRFGRGFVMQDDGEELSVPKGATGDAFWGDRVEVRWKRRGKRFFPYVHRVVKRQRELYVVTIEQVRDYAFGHPADTRIHADFFIPARHLRGAKNDEKVLIELLEWPDREDNPIGRVVEILGPAGMHEVEMHAILAEFGLPYEFPPEVEEAAQQVDRTVTAEEVKKRRDMRGVTTFTIDPKDAKDFDDALSLQRLENGNVEVGVHIADVTHYLKEGGVIDAEARQRATSVYLVDRTIPMLPEVLSNDLCSLRPHEDRLAFSAVFELDGKARVVNEWFGRTIIHSNRRFTYEEAQERIETGTGDHAEDIAVLQDLAVKLREARFRQGGIDFNTEEVKFELAEDGTPLRVVVKVMRDSNKLIEDFMLLANVRVARFLADPKKEMMPGSGRRTAVYRVHDKPDPEKLAQLRLFVERFGLEMEKPTAANAEEAIRNLLQAAAGNAGENVIKTMAIRSMAKAEYSVQNIGHYGLAFPFYTHFTSPIRRYPDVMVHRLLQHYLDGKPSPDPGTLEGQCRVSSNMEKQASDAERASIKYKQVEFLSTRIGETFIGIVSGMMPRGIFVEIEENKCEGMVAKDLLPKNDHWVYNDDLVCFTGLRSNRVIHMGDRVHVRVVAADLAKRQLEFEWVEA